MCEREREGVCVCVCVCVCVSVSESLFVYVKESVCVFRCGLLEERVRFAQWVSRCMRESVYACEGA